MLVMVVFFIAFRWIHLSTPLIRLFLLVLILLLMPTLNFLPVWFALSLLRFRLPSRLPMMFILWMVAMMVVTLLPKKLFRIRMSRNFGMKMLTMTNLSTECLIQLTKLGYDATPFNQILKQNAKREMRLRLGKVTVADVLAAQPVTTNLLKF